jgi:iron complex transport system permease protein
VPPVAVVVKQVPRRAASVSGGVAATNARRGSWLLACVGLLVVVCALSLVFGNKDIDLATVWNALWHNTGTYDQNIITEQRVPRTVLGVLAGAALGVSGAVIQAVTRNPLADTQVLGLNAGAGLFVVFAIGVLGLTSIWSYLWFAFLGVAMAGVGVYALGSVGRGGGTPIRLTLAGIALGAVMEGVSSGIRLVKPRAFDYLRFWDAGALSGRSLAIVMAIVPFVAVGLLLALVVARSLNAVALGDDLARTLGTNVAMTRVLAVASVTLLAGAATAAAGPIGFVGLMVPHAVRWLVGPDQRWIIGFTVVCAPILMLCADIVGRVVLGQAELPVGIVTAFVGAPVLIWLVRRTKSVGP